MEQQSTSATPSKRQDYVQYSPQIVTNYNQQFDHQQGGLGSPTQEHYEDSMLELKDVDTLPSNYAFVSHQVPPNNNMPPQVIMMPLSQPVMYLPAETQQRVYETPSNNNYIHHSDQMIMNPNVHMMPSPSSAAPSQDMSKYTSWTRVVLIFAVILGIYGCFVLVSQVLSLFTLGYQNSSGTGYESAVSIPSIISGFLLSIFEIAAAAVGVWSTITKNEKHRKYSTIGHLVLLSIVVVIHIASAIMVNLQIMFDKTLFASAGINPQNLTVVFVLSILFYILIIFACCGSCIGCQAYRFRIMTKLQDNQPESAQGEGFMVMRDEV